MEEEGPLPNSFNGASIYTDTELSKDSTKKENYRSVSLMDINANIVNKILANQIQQHVKKIIYHSIHESINVIHYINKKKG